MRLLALFLLLSSNPTISEDRKSTAQEIAQELSRLRIHKLYVPDFCTKDSHPNGPGAYFAATFSELLETSPKNFEILSRIDAHRFLLQNHWTDCDLSTPEILKKFANKFHIDSLLTANLLSNENGYSVDFILRDVSGKPLFRSPYIESLDPMIEGNFPAASSPSGWPFYFFHRDGMTNPKCISCTAPVLHKPGVSGIIIVSVYFTTEGKMEQFRLIQSLDPDLDAQALAALKSWQFNPAKDADNNPVPVRLSAEFPAN
jgi:TonB family protein